MHEKGEKIIQICVRKIKYCCSYESVFYNMRQSGVRRERNNFSNEREVRAASAYGVKKHLIRNKVRRNLYAFSSHLQVICTFFHLLSLWFKLMTLDVSQELSLFQHFLFSRHHPNKYLSLNSQVVLVIKLLLLLLVLGR
jgi:hypothetical protein